MVRPTQLMTAILALGMLPTIVVGQDLSETIGELNAVLAEHRFIDYDGAEGRSTVDVVDGRLRVEVRKVSETSDVANVYIGKVTEFVLDDMRTDFRDTHAAISIPSTGAVVSRLRCKIGTTTNEWDLPSVHAVTLELQDDARAVRETRELLRRVVRLAAAEAVATP